METIPDLSKPTNGTQNRTPVPQPDLVEQSATLRRSTVVSQAPTWLHTHLRNLIALGLMGLIGWLVYTGNKEAMTAVIAAFSVLMGAIWGERAALKVPGKDA
jgi:hypothetical protein